MHGRFCQVVGVRLLLSTCIKATIETEADGLITDFLCTALDIISTWLVLYKIE